MPQFSKRSTDNMQGVHPDIVDVLYEAIKHVDFMVIEGVRTMQRQKELVDTGRSTTMNSKHLIQGDGYGHAVDVIAYPPRWEAMRRNYLFAGWLKGFAKAKGVDLRIGADWDGDFVVKDQRFHDLVHFELLPKR